MPVLMLEDAMWSFEFESVEILTVPQIGKADFFDTLARLQIERPLVSIEMAPTAPPDLAYEVLYQDGSRLEELIRTGVTRSFEDTLLKVIAFTNHLSLKEIALHIQMGRTLTVLGNDFGLFRFEAIHK